MKDLIIKLINNAAADEDIEIVDARITSDLIRILIDKTDGVTMGDCTKLSRKLSHMFEEKEADSQLGAYRLEISSPGIDRPLSTEGDFKRNLGKKISVMFTDEGLTKSIEGKIDSAADEHVTIRTNKKSFKIPYQSINKAVLVLEW